MLHCVNERIMKISISLSDFIDLPNFNDCLVFLFALVLPYMAIFFINSLVILSETHALLDRGNLCHSDV